MRTSFFTPRSISALRAAASRLRKASSQLTQTEALNLAAANAGFANFTHAQRTLPEVMKALTLRCRWRDDSAKGTEVLKYPLPWTAEGVVSMRLKAARIASFEVFEDGLFCSEIASNRYMARYWLVQALRELMVIEATGLRPDYPKNRLPKVRQEFNGTKYFEPVQPPGADHLSAWYDSETKATLLMDEPYLRKDEEHSRASSRAEWCKRFDYLERSSAWCGTYLPPKSRLFLFAKVNSSINLDEIESKLNTLPDDFGALEEDWRGSSEESQTPSHAQMRQSLSKLAREGYLEGESNVNQDGQIIAIRKTQKL